MGLFSRNNPPDDENQDDLDDIELPTSSDLKANVFSEDEPVKPEPTGPSIKQYRARTGYGIEETIRLMKDLPRDNNEVVVTVVKKTLESTQIQVQDIVEDANAKEDRIRKQHARLEEEIKQLQEQIAQRNQQISDLLRDLKETTDVRQRLQLALELDNRRTAQAKAQSQAANPAQANSAQKAAPQPPGAAAQAPARPQTGAGDNQAAGSAQPKSTTGSQTAVPDPQRRNGQRPPPNTPR